MYNLIVTGFTTFGICGIHFLCVFIIIIINILSSSTSKSIIEKYCGGSYI